MKTYENHENQHEIIRACTREDILSGRPGLVRSKNNLRFIFIEIRFMSFICVLLNSQFSLWQDYL